MSSENEREFEKWLNSKECWNLLLDLGKRMRAKRVSSGLRYCRHGLETGDDIAAELWVMLKKRKGDFRGNMARILERGDGDALASFIASKASYFHKEQYRDRYHQRVRQVISGAGDSLGYGSGKEFSSYGSTKNSAQVVSSYEKLKDDGVGLIFPEIVPGSIKKKGTILELAMSFREQIEGSGVYGAEVRIPLRVLCAYIRDGWKELTEYEAVEYQVSEAGEGETRSTDELLSGLSEESCSEFGFSEEWLQEVADKATLKLDKMNYFYVLCLYHNCEFSQARIARILGLAGPSGVNARLKSSKHALASIVAQEEDIDEYRYSLFWKMFLSNCNDEDCSR